MTEIKVHSVVDENTLIYALDSFKSMLILAIQPSLLSFSLYFIGLPKNLEAQIETFEKRHNIKVSIIDIPLKKKGSAGHCIGAQAIFESMTKKSKAINIISDSDTLIVVKGWDEIIRSMLEKVDVIGTPYEDIGGWSSGDVKTQTYKKLPNLIWAAFKNNIAWNEIKIDSEVPKPMKIKSSQESQIYNVPQGYNLLKDTGWRLPLFLHSNNLSSDYFEYLHPTHPNSLVLKSTNWDYHEEYHIAGIPFVVHQRGSRKHKWNHGKSAVFVKASWDYINNVALNRTDIDYNINVQHTVDQPQPKKSQVPQTTKVIIEKVSDFKCIEPLEQGEIVQTEDIDYLLVSCCMEETRGNIVKHVAKNLLKEGINPEQFTIFDNGSRETDAVDFLKNIYPKCVHESATNVGYWSAIAWWLDNIATKKYTYIIESDLFHYDFDRIKDAEKFLNDNPKVGSVRTLKFDVDSGKYWKRPNNKKSTLPLVSNVSSVTKKKISCVLADSDKNIYTSNFPTMLPALNRRETMVKTFEILKKTKDFTEQTFQKTYWEDYPLTALLNGGIMHYDMNSRDNKEVVSGSWTPRKILASIGYQNPRRNNSIIPSSKMIVVHNG